MNTRHRISLKTRVRLRAFKCRLAVRRWLKRLVGRFFLNVTEDFYRSYGRMITEARRQQKANLVKKRKLAGLRAQKRKTLEIFSSPAALRTNVLRHGPAGYDLIDLTRFDMVERRPPNNSAQTAGDKNDEHK